MSHRVDEFQPSDNRQADVDFLHHEGFDNYTIADMVGVNERTVRRDLQSMGIPRYSNISDSDLLKQIKLIIKNQHAGIGEVFVEGELTDAGIIVQRERVRIALRSLGAIRKRADRVCHMPFNANRGPHYAWHLDQNEKMKRWRFLILSCIDGFCRHCPHFVLVDNLTGETHTNFSWKWSKKLDGYLLISALMELIAGMPLFMSWMRHITLILNLICFQFTIPLSLSTVPMWEAVFTTPQLNVIGWR